MPVRVTTPPVSIIEDDDACCDLVDYNTFSWNNEEVLLEEEVDEPSEGEGIQIKVPQVS